MKTINPFYFILFSVYLLCENAQAQFIMELYDTSSNVLINDVKPLAANKSLAVGFTTPFQSQYHDGMLVKMNAAGNIEWNRVYHSDIRSHQLNAALYDPARNHFVLVGTSYDSSGVVLFSILITDSSGHVISVQHYKDSAQTEFIPSVYTSLFSSDSNIVIAGFAYDQVHAGGNFLMKFDPGGNIIWSHVFSDTSYTIHNECMVLKETPDHGYAIAGTIGGPGLGTSGMEISRFDPNGNFLWHRIFTPPTGFQTQPQYMLIHPGGDIFVCGTDQDVVIGNDYRGFLLKTDSAGNIIYSYEYSSLNGCYFPSMAFTRDRNLIVNALTNVIPDGITTIIKADTAGTILWNKRIDDVDGNNYFGSMEPMSDGGYTLASTRGFLDTIYRYVSTYLRMDSIATSPCLQSVVSITQASVVFQEITAPVTYKSISLSAFSDTVNESSPVDIFLYCTSTGIAENETEHVTSLSIYPNPAHSKIFISLKEKISEDCELTFYDALGQAVITQKMEHQTESLDLSFLPGGIYQLIVKGKNIYAASKVIRM